MSVSSVPWRQRDGARGRKSRRTACPSARACRSPKRCRGWPWPTRTTPFNGKSGRVRWRRPVTWVRPWQIAWTR